MNVKKHNAALMLIDLQKGFDEEAYWGGNRNNKNAEQNAAMILEQWRMLSLPVFHIIHSSQDSISRLHKSHAGFEIKDEVKPIIGETIIEKQVNSAFIGTDLEQQLHNSEITKLVIVGLTTNHCVSTTTRIAGNLGFDVFLISDATATFDRIGVNGEKFDADTIHQITLANLHNEFAQVIDTEKLFQLL